MPIAEDLARYCHELSFDDLPRNTVEIAKNRIIDSVAAGIGAIEEETIRRIYELAREGSSEHASHIIGFEGSVPVGYATLLNTSIIRFFDLNDTYLMDRPGGGHPSGVIGAALSVADAYDCSGEDVLVATVLGYEIHCRLADAAPLRELGFDHSNYGSIAAALLAGKLMGLTAEELVNAVSIAVTGHVTLYRRGGKVTEWKGIAYGNAAKNGVFAARMAEAGVAGPTPVFEGRFGFMDQVSGEFDLDTESFGGRMGRYKIHDVLQKRYSICTHGIPTVDCVMEVVEEHDIQWTAVQSIEIETYSTAISHLADAEKWDPSSRELADHSIPYCVARTLIDGKLGLGQFTMEKITGEDVRQLMDRISIVENERFDDAYGETMPASLEIETANRRFAASVELPRGHPDRPLTDAEVRAKLSHSAKYSHVGVDIDAVHAAVNGIEHCDRIAGVFELLHDEER